MRSRLRTLVSVLAVALVIPLASCSSAPADTPHTSHDAAADSAATPAASAAPATPSIEECEEVELRAGTSVPGQVLGDCVAAAMIEAGSGVHRVDSSDGTSSVVNFRWDPDFAMSVDGGAQQVVIVGETGWVLMPETGWVQADPGSEDPIVVMATSIVKLVRVFSDPRVLAASFATSPTWTVVGEEPLPVDDADARTAWLVTPDAAMTILGVSLSDVQLWLRPDHLGAYFIGTGTIGGTSVTTSNTFLHWGAPVEITVPDEAD